MIKPAITRSRQADLLAGCTHNRFLQPFFAMIERQKRGHPSELVFLTAAINYTTIPKWFVTRHATAKLIIMVVKDSSSTYLQLASS
jgi:hypothetical protein